MIVASITGRAKPGRLNDASAFVQKYAETIERITGAKTQIGGEVGELNSILVATQHDSMADFDAAIEKCWGSEEYRKILDDAVDIFDSEANQVHVWKIID